MAEVASYYIIQDNSFELPDHPEGRLEIIEESHVRIFNFSLPAGALTNRRSILSFVANPQSFGGDLDVGYEIRVNGGDPIFRGSHNTEASRGLWEVIGRSKLLADEVNAVEFRILPGETGTIVFSDVVLSFKIRVADAS